MYKRDLEAFLAKIAVKYPVITLIGPRQSGKSTLSRRAFPDYAYVSLETPDHRSLAQEDPRRFFHLFPERLIIDEVQRVPELLSYIQTLVDEPGNQRHFVLTGSQQLLLMEKITQSLAGRTTIAKLLPFSHQEIIRGPEEGSPSVLPRESDSFLFVGGYPRIYHQGLDPTQWLEQYFQTYVERDVRHLSQIASLDLFDRFVRLCAGRAGQLLNLSSLANDCDISPPTAGSWVGILQTSFICFLLRPHFRNFSKRLIKSPKLYFYDTGLLCYLLKIRSSEALSTHPLRGSIFENWVISEMMKGYFNRGEEPPFYFWRDTKGHEVDLVVDEGTYLYPVEIKSAHTFRTEFIGSCRLFAELQGQFAQGKKHQDPLGDCIYGGDTSFAWENYRVKSWREL